MSSAASSIRRCGATSSTSFARTRSSASRSSRGASRSDSDRSGRPPSCRRGSTWAGSRSRGRSTGSTSTRSRRVGIVQDYKSGKTAFSAAKIDSRAAPADPAYMLVLRDLVGIEPLGGLYRALAGEGTRAACARQREGGSARVRLRPITWTRTSSGARSRRGRTRGGTVERIRDGDVEHDPKGGFPCPILVRPVVDVPGEASVERGGPITSSSRRSRRPASSSSRPAPGRERRRCWSSATCAPSATGGSTSSRFSSSPTRSARPASSRSRIRARLRELGRHDLARALDGAWISTIHGFCHRLLKAHPFAAGIDPRYRVLDDSQSRVVSGRGLPAGADGVLRGMRWRAAGLLATYGARGRGEWSPAPWDASFGRSPARARAAGAVGASRAARGAA